MKPRKVTTADVMVDGDERQAALARQFEIQEELALVAREIERLSQSNDGSARADLLDQAAAQYLADGAMPALENGRLDEAELRRLCAQRNVLTRARELARRRVVEITDACSRRAQAEARAEVLALVADVEQAVAAMRTAADKWTELHDRFNDAGLSVGLYSAPPKAVMEFESSRDWAVGLTVAWAADMRRHAGEVARAA